MQLLQGRVALVVIDGIDRRPRGWSRGSADRAAADDVEQARGQEEGLDDFLAAMSGLSNGTHLVLTTRALPACLRDVGVSFVPMDEEGRRYRWKGLTTRRRSAYCGGSASAAMTRRSRGSPDSTRTTRWP